MPRVVRVDLHTLTAVNEFRSFVRPTVDTTLTDFCKELTGIQQASVDTAPTLPEVLQEIDEWLSSNGLEYGPDRP